MAGATWKGDGGLDRALAAAGIAADASPEATPSGEAKPQLPPPPTPAELVAFLSAINGTVCRLAATVWQVKVSKEELAELSTLSKEEKDTLATLAPYAAEYAPEIMTKFKPVMAWTFVGFYVLMSGQRVMAIRAKAPKKLTKAAEMAPEYKDPSNG